MLVGTVASVLLLLVLLVLLNGSVHYRLVSNRVVNTRRALSAIIALITAALSSAWLFKTFTSCRTIQRSQCLL